MVAFGQKIGQTVKFGGNRKNNHAKWDLKPTASTLRQSLTEFLHNRWDSNLTPTEIIPEALQMTSSSNMTKEAAMETKTVTSCCGSLESAGCDTLMDDDFFFFF